ncbi:unnamed protein product [Rhizoctonia solani]|uniref:Uncharacterized protein n=1 Tax=Rhizoctonia solani TaxID=456999 RepID=A0A8H3A356_9AGAM|nr:unnamed protein product [Rhizoctonia solani]
MVILSALAVLSGRVGEHVRALARTAAGENVRDVFSTLPADLTQIQQRTVISAAVVAGMKLVALINDGTTIAVHYARPDNSPLASPPNPKASPKPPSSTLALTRLLPEPSSPDGSKLFSKQKSGRISSPSRLIAYAREAERIKSISSVNDEANASAEGLVGDNDFKIMLERKARSRTCSGGSSRTLWMELAPVFWQADVESAILHGQNARLRFVQTVAKNDVSLVKLTTDADKACVLGTAFYATLLSRHFKTQPVKFQDASFAKFTRIMLPSTRSTTGLDKASTPEYEQPFDVVAGFNEPSAAYDLTERGATDDAVKFTLLYSEDGLASITEAVVVGTVKDNGLTAEGSLAVRPPSRAASASEETKVEDEPDQLVEKIESIAVSLILEPAIVKPMSLDKSNGNLISNIAVPNASVAKHSTTSKASSIERVDVQKSLSQACGSGVGRSRDELAWDEAGECGSEQTESEGCEAEDCNHDEYDERRQGTGDSRGKDQR